MPIKMLRPDSKGRITLGTLAKGISGFSMRQEPNGTVILEPFVEIPINEKWLFDNTVALNKVRTGLEQLKKHQLIDRGSFSEFANEETD